jgi:thiol-disulfide isomerase/thioredoxin
VWRVFRRTSLGALLLTIVVLAAACGGGGGDEVQADADGAPAAPVPSAGGTESSGGDAEADASAGGGTIEAPGGTVSFTAAKVGGGELDSASLLGTDAVLWFWAPWCTTCRSEAPDVAAVAAQYEGRVTFVGVAGRGSEPEMEAFVAETGTDGFGHLVDDDGSIWATFQVLQQPAFAFLDDSGEVQVVSGRLGRAELTERVNGLLAS